MSKFLDGLNEKQQQAVLATEGPVLVIAGAGSGKTKTLTHRIAYLVEAKGVAPHQILAVTFTNKAAGEIRERTAALLRANHNTWHTWRGFGSGPVLGTFHSICVRILREEAGKLGYKESFVIFDTSDQKSAMRQVMKQEGVSSKQINPNTVLNMISRVKHELLLPDDMELNARGPAEELAAKLYRAYQIYLQRHHAMDFDDLLGNCVRLFQQFPDVLKSYQEKWRYIMIDEYQDTNHVQYLWARLLAGEPSSTEASDGKRNNIFVVGDDWQGIYSWRGATIRNILEFEQDYPGSLVIRLEQNYRSTKPIVALGNTIIAGNKEQMKKNLWTETESAGTPEVWEVQDEHREAEFVLEKIAELEGTTGKEKGKRKKEQSSASPTEQLVDEIEYDYAAEGGGGSGILDKIMGSMGYQKTPYAHNQSPIANNQLLIGSIPPDMGLRKIPWNKYAVLYRTNAQSRALEEVLLKHTIPYRLIGGVRFYERKEIKDMLAYMRLALNPNDSISLMRIMNEPARGIGEKTLAKIQEAARARNEDILHTMEHIVELGIIPPSRASAAEAFADVYARLRENKDKLSVIEMIDYLLKRSGYFSYLQEQGSEGEERIENIQELKAVAQKFDGALGDVGLTAFLEDIALVADVDSYQTAHGEALTLMTLHSAKGLEFDTVFLVGLEEGLLPHSGSLIDPQELEEERRLCYVGITRAKKVLYFVHTRMRVLHGSLVSNMPSRFLSELGDEHVVFYQGDM